MTNPYALPLRLRRQRLSDLRQAVAQHLAAQAEIVARDTALGTQATAERALRGATVPGDGDSWFDWQRRTRAALGRQAAILDGQLARLRDEMRDELGQIAALEEAERRLFASERRQRERRAQAIADDRAAALFLAEAA